MILTAAYKRYKDWRRKCRIWKEHRNITRYHLVGDRYDIGEFTYGVPTIHAYDNTTRLKIGKYCSIASGVEMVLGGNHHTKWVSTYAFYQETDIFTRWDEIGEIDVKRGDIEIGHDVWIGRNALILSGAKVGNGAVIGAGAVVAGHVPPYSIVVGNPAKVIKHRFTPPHYQQVTKFEVVGFAC